MDEDFWNIESEIRQIVPASPGWKQVFLTFEEPDTYMPQSGYGVNLIEVAVWALVYVPAEGELIVSGLTGGYGMLKGQDYQSFPERVVGFVGYLAPERGLGMLEDAVEFTVEEEEVIGKPWTVRGGAE